MTKEQIMSIVETIRGGTFHTIRTHKRFDLSAKKWGGYDVQADSVMSVSIGVRYENTPNGKLKIMNGEKIEKPNGMHFILYPYVLQSDYDPNKYYLRVYSNPNKNAKHSKRFILNGEETTREHLAEIGMPKSVWEKKEYEPQTPMPLPIGNIVSIN